ncbi:MAG: hypothetical protein Q7U54_09535 [Bacteroidales bacterium]|nr:hypothetical protein [Bacteroidales bacterium]
MKINYKFISDKEPSDKQLQLLMREVAIEAKLKAEKANKQFFLQLEQLLLQAKKLRSIYNTDPK